VRAGRTCGQCQLRNCGGQDKQCRRMVRGSSGLRCRGTRMDARAEITNSGLLAGRERVAAMLVRDAGDLDRDQNQRKQQRLSQATH